MHLSDTFSYTDLLALVSTENAAMKVFVIFFIMLQYNAVPAASTEEMNIVREFIDTYNHIYIYLCVHVSLFIYLFISNILGKTMFAKGLARESGLHYAIMTGGDVAPLGKEAVTEIHKLFDWANTTNKGVLLFVDEADAFLRKRSTEKISEDMRNALNAFLYRTGEASQKFMIVYASNQPEQFDWAINDRIDEMVEFRLPGFDERLAMVSSYMDKYLLNPSEGSKPITVEGVDESVLRTVATMTENYSGREISKLAIAWQAAAYGTDNATLSTDLLLQVLAESKDSKAQKVNWLQKEQADNMVRDAVV